MPKFEWTKRHTAIFIYTCATMLIAIAIVFAILFPDVIFGAVADIFGAISPVFYGFAIAYLFHPVCDFFENKLFYRLRDKNGRAAKAARVLSVICTFVLAAAVIAAFIGILVPQVVNSYLSFESRLEGYLQNATDWINGFVAEVKARDEFGLLPSFVGTGNVTDVLADTVGSMFGFIGNVADKVLEYSSKVLGVAAKVVVSIIFAVYFLLEKKTIISWISKISYSLLPGGFVNGVSYWISYTNKVFSSFITGKIVNALLITVINFIVFGICGIPYYPLVALVTGVTDLIPYFGPFIGAIPCAFIILIADPVKVIWFIVLVLVIQQVDGNIVGPKILGEKVGVDSLVIIVAITIGGSLFGIAGMFISVPVFTVLLHAANSFLDTRLRKKGLPTEMQAYEKSSKEAAK